MPRNCTICNHLQRVEVEAALLDDQSYRHIASRYGTSTGALQRHKKSCVASSLAKAAEVKETLNGESLLARLKAINAETLAILKEARNGKGKDAELALKAIARVEKQIELEGKLLGELNDVPQVNIHLSIYRLQAVIINALAGFPDAKVAVSQALMEAKL